MSTSTGQSSVSHPGVFIEETSAGVHPIAGVPTSITAFIGRAARGPVNKPVTIHGFAEYERIFGGLRIDSAMSFAVRDFFENGGTHAVIVRLRHGRGRAALTKKDDFTPANARAEGKGLYALEQTDLFNVLCIPPYGNRADVESALIAEAALYCEERRAMLLVDPPNAWKTMEDAATGVSGVGTGSKNAALYFPRLRRPNPLRNGQPEDFVPSGAVAGVYARTDSQRGVWKAPAGLEATLVGGPKMSVALTDAQNGELNALGINRLRVIPSRGLVVWGSRTLQGNDRLGSEWKYVPVRRTALFVEESIDRGTKWVVFEPNAEPLWAVIRLNVGAFMNDLFRRGAFQGRTPKEAYFVKCDSETTTPSDINLGVVNIVVGFAPLKPAEFVVLRIQQKTART
ncbi:MAG TPA: phage tail sheath C-terminal domain-containing protein [Chthoniobacterales bacterium]|jgi:hypothetical protein